MLCWCVDIVFTFLQVESEIKKKLLVWEKENETYFMFKGCRYIDYLDNQKVEYEEDQKLKKEEKVLNIKKNHKTLLEQFYLIARSLKIMFSM